MAAGVEAARDRHFGVRFSGERRPVAVDRPTAAPTHRLCEVLLVLLLDGCDSRQLGAERRHVVW